MLTNFYHCPNEIGTDEAGRGCLAGPVTAAAVILPEDFHHDMLNDSKKLSESKRNLLRPFIEEHCLCFAVAHVFPKKIDEINILNASILAMHKAIDLLNRETEYIIVDGNKFKPYKEIPHACIIKGDGKYKSIAAASILAKTYRDSYMEELHLEFPMYQWNINKGYPTKKHRDAIRTHGLTKFHRLSFRQLPEQLELGLF